MKYWLSLILIFLSFQLSDSATIDNLISIEGRLEVSDFTVVKGDACESQLHFHIDSGEDFRYAGLQFDLVCPEGVELTEVRAGDDLKGYILRRNGIEMEQPGNKERIVVYGNGLQATDATENLLFLTFAVSSDAPLGEKTGRVERVYLSDPLGRDILLEDSEFTVTVITTRAETPTELLRKGDGTSHTFVAIVESDDRELEAEGYRYVFGYDNATEGAKALEDTPWRYTYTTADIYWNMANDFWVFDYYIDSRGTLRVSARRHLDGSIDEDFNPADFIGHSTRSGEHIVGIFTVDGQFVGKDLDALDSGIYIVKTPTSSIKIIR